MFDTIEAVSVFLVIILFFICLAGVVMMTEDIKHEHKIELLKLEKTNFCLDTSSE